MMVCILRKTKSLILKVPSRMIKMILKVISNNLINLIINLIKYFDIELTISVLQSEIN